MGKLDQIRALREARFAESKAQGDVAAASESLADLKENVAAVNNNTVNKVNKTNKKKELKSSSPVNRNAEYQQRWREDNSDLNRLRARNGMRKLRAKVKSTETIKQE